MFVTVTPAVLPSVTLRVYAHVIQDLTAAVADTFARAILTEVETKGGVSKGVRRSRHAEQ
jgi:hypothetical protein